MAKKQSRLARIKQLAAADAGRKAKRAKAQPVIVQIEGDASPALKAAMLKTIAAHVVSWHDVHAACAGAVPQRSPCAPAWHDAQRAMSCGYATVE